MSAVGGLLTAVLPLAAPARPTALPVLQLPEALMPAAQPRLLAAVVAPPAAAGQTVLETAEGPLTLAGALPFPPGARVRLELRTDGAGRIVASAFPPEAKPAPAAEPGADRIHLVYLGRADGAADAAAEPPQAGDALRFRRADLAPEAGGAPAAAGRFTATVIRADAGGLLLATPFGAAALPPDAPLRPGVALALPLVDATPALPTPPALPAPPALQAVAELGREWPALRTALHHLARSRPELAAAVQAELPQPGPHLLRQVLRFATAVRSGEVERWLGAEAAAALATAEAEGCIERLREDFGRLQGLADADADWRAYLVPLCAGGEPQQLRLYVRDRGDGRRGRAAEDPARFVVELDLSRIGALQFDGLCRSRQVSLIVRSARRLPPGLPDEIRDLFQRSLTAAGMTGEIRFEPEAPFSAAPLAALAGRGAGIRV